MINRIKKAAVLGLVQRRIDELEGTVSKDAIAAWREIVRIITPAHEIDGVAVVLGDSVAVGWLVAALQMEANRRTQAHR